MNIGFLMDPLSKIHTHKDTTFAMLLASQQRGFKNSVMMPEDIWLQNGIAWGRMQSITVYDDLAHPFDLGESTEAPLADLDVLLMRKDPPITMDYIYLTQLLEIAESQGLRVINKPSSLRDVNEKLFTAWFPQCCPKTMVTSQKELILDFADSVERAVIKPLDNMGGTSVFQLSLDDHVILCHYQYSFLQNKRPRKFAVGKNLWQQQFADDCLMDGTHSGWRIYHHRL